MKRRIAVSIESVGRRTVVLVLNDSACVFAGISCLVCSFAKNTSFMNCLFSLSASSSADYSFFTDRTDEGTWSVGCLIIVLLIRLLTKHIHQTNVHDESFRCCSRTSISSRRLWPFFATCFSKPSISTCRAFLASLIDRYTSRKLVELLLYLNRRFQLLKVQLETLPEDELINKYSNPMKCNVM